MSKTVAKTNSLTKKQLLVSITIATTLVLAGCDSDDDDDSGDVLGDSSSTDSSSTDSSSTDSSGTDSSGTADSIAPETRSAMSFFVTSEGVGDGGNLGGLAGADVHCANLAASAGATATEWRAYLSTTGADGANAIDRIGNGPWVNSDGVTVANDTADLLSDGNNLHGLTAITENGDTVPGRGSMPNRHDILTGTELNGLASTDGTDTTCSNWTSNSTGSALVGHHDRSGPLIDFVVNPNSWSTAHPSTGCGQEDLQGTGGDGLFYCFVQN